MKNMTMSVLVMLVMGIGVASASNVIQNNSFENPVIPNSGYVSNAGANWLNGGNLTGWTGSFVNYGNGNSWFAYGAFGAPAQDGNQMVSLQNYALWQNTGIQMKVGDTYTLSGFARYSASNSGSTHFVLIAMDGPTVNLAGGLTQITEAVYPGTQYSTTWSSTPNVTVSYTCTAEFAGKYLAIEVAESSPLVNGVNTGKAVLVDNVSLDYTPLASTPVFSPGGKYISGPTAITITSTTPNAKIYYTINNTTPTTSSSLYSGPVTVNGGTTLKAIAVADGYQASSVASMTYVYSRIQNPSFENPMVSGVVSNADANWLNGGNLAGWTGSFVNYGNGNNWFAYGKFGSSSAKEGSQMVSMQNYALWQNTGIQMKAGDTYAFSGFAKYTANNSGATRFALIAMNTSAVNLAGWMAPLAEAEYSGSEFASDWSATANVSVSYTCTSECAGKYLVLTISESSPLVNGVNTGSAVFVDDVSLVYTPIVSAPVFSPGGKYISGPTAITITSATPGASIYYTIDNSTPTTSSPLYTGPVTVYGGTVLKAIAVANGYNTSAVTSMTYVYSMVKNPSFENPIVPDSGFVYNTDANWSNGGNLTDWSGGFVNYGKGNHWFAYGNFGSGSAKEGDQMVSMQNYGLSQHTGIQMQAGTTYTLSGYARYATSNSGITLFRLVSTSSATLGGSDASVINSALYLGTSPFTEWSSSPNVTVSYTCTDFDAGKYLILSIIETSPFVNGANTGAAVLLDNINLTSTPTASAPVFNPSGKYISGPTAITITSATPGASIYYTIDNSTPTTGSPLYSGPVTVNGGTVLKAIAVSNGYANSVVTSLTFINNSAMSQLTRGHYLLIEKGLQIQALTFPDMFGTPMPSLDRFAESKFTGFIYLDNPLSPTWYPAPGPQWGRWSRHAAGLQDFELPYLSQMVSFQYGDEMNISDSATVQKMKKWFALNRLRYPDVISHDDQASNAPYSLEINKAYVAEAQPDMVMVNVYPFKGNLIGGSPTSWYDTLQKYRQIGLAGLDGNGSRPIPYAHYLQAWPDTGHTPSESEIRLDQFGGWAFGYKFAEAFVYTKAPSPPHDNGLDSILFTGNGDSTPTAKFAEFAETNRQSRNLGSALVRLLSTDVRFIAGQHGQSSAVDNNVPSSVTSGIAGADSYLTGVSATNLGSKNYGRRGDVIVGFFKPLHESFDGDTYSNQKYFMVVNGLTDGTGSAAETQQMIRLTFNMGSSHITSLHRLNRNTGLVEIVPLTSEGNGIYHVDLTLDGGTGDLFKYNTGAPFVGVSEAPKKTGDANGDGMVDVGDLGILAANYGGSGKTWAQGDFNGDGLVDVGDLGILAAHYGEGSSQQSNFSDDYTKAFGTTETDDTQENSTIGNTLCNSLGLPIIVGILLMSLLFVKLEK